MKKNIKVLVPTILLICLISCVLMLIFIKKQSNQKICEDFELNDVLVEVNLATNNRFSLLSSDVSLYIPVIFSQDTDYVFGYNNENLEYFILVKEPNEQEILELKDFVDTNNSLHPNDRIKIGENGKYIYIISSGEYDSIVEGIIRSYIYC